MLQRTQKKKRSATGLPAKRRRKRAALPVRIDFPPPRFRSYPARAVLLDILGHREAAAEQTWSNICATAIVIEERLKFLADYYGARGSDGQIDWSTLAWQLAIHHVDGFLPERPKPRGPKRRRGPYELLLQLELLAYEHGVGISAACELVCESNLYTGSDASTLETNYHRCRRRIEAHSSLSAIYRLWRGAIEQTLFDDPPLPKDGRLIFLKDMSLDIVELFMDGEENIVTGISKRLTPVETD